VRALEKLGTSSLSASGSGVQRKQTQCLTGELDDAMCAGELRRKVMWFDVSAFAPY
jgi:hypothetical protein